MFSPKLLQLSASQVLLIPPHVFPCQSLWQVATDFKTCVKLERFNLIIYIQSFFFISTLRCHINPPIYYFKEVNRFYIPIISFPFFVSTIYANFHRKIACFVYSLASCFIPTCSSLDHCVVIIQFRLPTLPPLLKVGTFPTPS